MTRKPALNLKPQTSNLQRQTLAEWLEHIERVHPSAVALGLERVQSVRRALGLNPSFPIIIVGGTNGKGSVCAMLEAILHHAGYRVGCYTSPHLLRYNERVRIGKEEAGDEDLVRAFAAVESARGETALTYFEFGTLAAVWLFVERAVEAAVLEVGLGGRLDAVNAFDADCAVVASVDLDHMDYLGGDREAIGFEKAGIFRSGRPAICGDFEPPATLKRSAAEIGAQLMLIGVDFGYTQRDRQWDYWGPRGKRGSLPHPVLRGQVQLGNAAAAVTALETLRDRLPVANNDVRTGLLQAEVPGRFQVLPGRPAFILDVAHNPHAARALAANLSSLGRSGKTLAVFAMLKDKDIAGVIDAVKPHIAQWFIAGIAAPRGASAELLAERLAAAGVAAAVTRCDSIAAACTQACDLATENDRILVFGSFYTVAEAMQLRAQLA
jgi:dihydrofolate synthase/folylpolyglutamate synthase